MGISLFVTLFNKIGTPLSPSLLVEKSVFPKKHKARCQNQNYHQIKNKNECLAQPVHKKNRIENRRNQYIYIYI